MITVQLNGGLGNQMFQYAVGKWLAKKLDTRLTLETSLCNPTRPYNLWHFNIEAIPIAGYLSTISRLLTSSTYQELSFEYNSNILTVQDNTFLKGYWQSEKYFKDIFLDLLFDFTRKNPVPPDLLKQERQIIDDPYSVSVHIRRGDYVGNLYHPVIPKEYYLQAIEKIVQTIDNPHFYIFTDDVPWVKKYFGIPYTTTFVNTGKDHEDHWLMRQCENHIIANSSFSWWGAWLSWNPDKVVVAPMRWFTDENINTNDLIPKEWVRI